MCSMKTEAMKSRLITSTGTGPLSQQRQSEINTNTNTHNPIICSNPNQSESLSGVADFIDELRKQGGALISEGGTEWGGGGGGRIAK